MLSELETKSPNHGSVVDGFITWYENSILDLDAFCMSEIWGHLMLFALEFTAENWTYLVMLSTAGGEPLHAEAVKGDSEEAVSDHEGEAQPTGRSQQGDLGSQQVGEFVSGAAET